MSHKLDDITLYHDWEDDRGKEFTIRQNVVSGLYVHLLNGYKPKGTSRVSVSFGQEDMILPYCGSILVAIAKFDKDEYQHQGAEERNGMILDTVHRIAMQSADIHGWDKSVFQWAYAQVVKRNFVFEKTTKLKWARNKKYKAGLAVVNYGCYISVAICFYRPDDTLLNQVTIFLAPELFYSDVIKQGRWFDDGSFGLYAQQGQWIIKAFPAQDFAEILMTPKGNSREYIEAYVSRYMFGF